MKELPVMPKLVVKDAAAIGHAQPSSHASLHKARPSSDARDILTHSKFCMYRTSTQGIGCQGVEYGIDMGRPDVRGHILLQTQHPAIRLELPRVCPDHVAQPRDLLVLQGTSPLA